MSAAPTPDTLAEALDVLRYAASHDGCLRDGLSGLKLTSEHAAALAAALKQARPERDDAEDRARETSYACFDLHERCAAAEAALTRADGLLAEIADSYPWEPYTDDEVIRRPGEPVRHFYPPTNRRIAREYLASRPGGAVSEPGASASIHPRPGLDSGASPGPGSLTAPGGEAA